MRHNNQAAGNRTPTGKGKTMKRILVVEDEASIRELVALNLKMTGWEVLEAPSAERALELIQKNPPAM